MLINVINYYFLKNWTHFKTDVDWKLLCNLNRQSIHTWSFALIVGKKHSFQRSTLRLKYHLSSQHALVETSTSGQTRLPNLWSQKPRVIFSPWFPGVVVIASALHKNRKEWSSRREIRKDYRINTTVYSPYYYNISSFSPHSRAMPWILRCWNYRLWLWFYFLHYHYIFM